MKAEKTRLRINETNFRVTIYKFESIEEALKTLGPDATLQYINFYYTLHQRQNLRNSLT